jgi:hypothetical protein
MRYSPTDSGSAGYGPGEESNAVHHLPLSYIVTLAAIPVRPDERLLKLDVVVLAASVPRYNTKASRSCKLEKLRRTSVHQGHPPASFCPAAAVCRISCLVLGDIHAISVALVCTTALIMSDYTPLSTGVQPATMSLMPLDLPRLPSSDGLGYCAASADSDISDKSNHTGTVPLAPGRVQVRSSSK